MDPGGTQEDPGLPDPPKIIVSLCYAAGKDVLFLYALNFAKQKLEPNGGKGNPQAKTLRGLTLRGTADSKSRSTGHDYSRQG